MKLIYKIPIIGSVVYYIRYVIKMVAIPLVCKAGKYEKLKFGSCVIWTPENRKQAIVEGIEFLKVVDEKMFDQLTTEGRLILFYTTLSDSTFGGCYYGLSERFIKWGREGIAAFLVQSFLMFKASPGINKVNLKKDELTALKFVPRQVMEWMSHHSFQPNFIKAYDIAVKNWEAGNSFLPCVGTRTVSHQADA